MRRGLLAVMVVAGAILGGGTPASAQAAPQRFVLYQGPEDDHFTVYAAGPISGVGTDFLLDEGTDASGRTQRRTETVFDAGSTFNTLTVLENSLSLDARTCVARVSGRSHLEITGGTGAYEGVTGSGEVTFQAVSVGQRTSEGCSRTGARTYSVAHITGTATLDE